MSPKPGTDSSSLFDAIGPAIGDDVSAPHYLLEKALIDRGKQYVAGVDEAGRGPLAGPVVAAAVILDPATIPAGLNDSKKLTAKRREALFEAILESALGVAWHSASAKRIDQINILQASLEAMVRAVQGLYQQPDVVLFDGRDVPLPFAENGHAVIKGDGISNSIAAASVVAKVIRDRIMIRADHAWPQYGFSGHKGYGSAKHITAIKQHGPCPIHRMSFSPMKDNKKGP